MSQPLLTELPYIGSLSFHALLLRHAPIYIEVWENFQKATYRNRVMIAGPNGVERLSIPIEDGRGLRCPIKQVRISYAHDWPKLHWSALVAAYGRSPFFEFYQHDIKPLYDNPGELLFDFNLRVMQTSCKLLAHKPDLKFTEDYSKQAPEGWLNVRSALHPNPDKNRAGEWTRPIPYYQVFQDRHGFLPDLCAWDLLFNEGPNATTILKQMVIG